MVLHANASPAHPTWPSSKCYRNLSHNPFTSDLNPLEEQSNSCNLKLLDHQYFEIHSQSLMQTWCLDPHFDLIFTSTTSRILHKQTTDLICILISLCFNTNPLYRGIILHANQRWKESNPLMNMRRSEKVLDNPNQLLIWPSHAHPHFWSEQQANWQEKQHSLGTKIAWFSNPSDIIKMRKNMTRIYPLVIDMRQNWWSENDS